MKTDEELLKLAAKACGLDVKAIAFDENDNFRSLIIGKKNTKERIPWNPMLDNNDAMILSVFFAMDIQHFASSVKVFAQYDGYRTKIIAVDIEKSRITSMRRAIVRAAAAIGELK